MRGRKRSTAAVVDVLRKSWREGEARAALREASGLDDGAIERALGDEQAAAELASFAQLMVRESLLAVVHSQIARAMKDTTGAKQFFELAQMAKLLEGAPVNEDAAAEMNELERTILEGLRNTLAEETA